MNSANSIPPCVQEVADVHGRLCELEMAEAKSADILSARQDLQAALLKAAEELPGPHYLQVWEMIDSARLSLELAPLALPIRPHLSN